MPAIKNANRKAEKSVKPLKSSGSIGVSKMVLSYDHGLELPTKPE